MTHESRGAMAERSDQFPSASAPVPPPSKIQFDRSGTLKKHEEAWKRTPNMTGTGAIHVRTFHCKFSEDALHFVDQQINEWLDSHPQYEVKHVTTSVGEWTGKLGKETHLVVQVWV